MKPDNKELTSTFRQIGVLNTPHHKKKGIPIQGIQDLSCRGSAQVFEEFIPGLRDIEGFSHIVLVYAFHESVGFDLEVIPYKDTKKHGVFATRAPRRPNPIGISVVKLIRVNGGTIEFAGADMLDGTPLLDIKPFLWDLYRDIEYHSGWTRGGFGSGEVTRSDDRF